MFRLTTCAISAVAVVLVACGGAQTKEETRAEGPLARAIQSEWWVTDWTDDGGLIVKEEHGLEPGEEPIPPDQLENAIESAAERQSATDFPEFYPDVIVQLNDPGVVELSGQVATEKEVVSVIDKALAVRGVHTVISYVAWPNREIEVARLQRLSAAE